MHRLYWNTVTPLLRKVLDATMKAAEFQDFRLVGGTSLSLQHGHRLSVDIDLFTDSPYGSIDFTNIERSLAVLFPYVSSNQGLPVVMGASWFVGNNEEDAVKLDVYYTETFIRPAIYEDNLSLLLLKTLLP
jgi:hypothetical protein